MREAKGNPLFRWLGRHPAGFFLSLAILAGGIWSFGELADEVFDGNTTSFDEAVLMAFRSDGDPDDPIGPHWVEEAGRDITALGSMGVLIILTLAVIGFLLLEHKYRIALLITVSVGGGILVSTLLKEFFERPRPDLVPHGMGVFTSSFPSGHSMMSAITYLTLAALLARLHTRRRVRSYLFITAALITLAVGVSRIYMGVHWPTDVLAGWTAGAIWAVLCWEVARWLQRRGAIEQKGVEPEVIEKEAMECEGLQDDD